MYSTVNTIEIKIMTAPSIKYGTILTIMINKGRANSHVKKTKSIAAITNIMIGKTVINFRPLPPNIRVYKRLPRIK